MIFSSFIRRVPKMIFSFSNNFKNGLELHPPRLYTAVGVPTNRRMGNEYFIFKQLLTVIVLFLSFIAIGFSCKRKNNYAAENVVYYYPEKNIYYDSLQSNYYYSLDGGRSWDSMAFKAPGYGTVLGPKIPIKRSANNVWENNESHRKDFNGILLNIINKQTILLSKADSINKLNAIQLDKTQPGVIEKEAVPERGLKKFLNKIFGKKKKPAEEGKQ